MKTLPLDDGSTKMYTLRMPNKHREMLEKYCKEECIPMAVAIRKAITMLCKEKS